MARLRLRPPRWLIWTGAPVLAVLLLVAGGIGYLRSEAGGRLLGRELAQALGSATGSEVTVAAVAGALPFAVEIKDARFAAAGRTWLAVDRLAVGWSPWALLAGRLQIDAIIADSVVLDGLPPPGPAPAKEPGPPSLAIELPKLPLAVTVARLQVGRLALGPEVVGEAVALKIDGHARLTDTLAEAELGLDAERIDGRAGSVRLRLGREAASPDLLLRLAVEEPAGGLVARTLALPGLPPVRVSLDGKGPVGDWQGRLEAEAGETRLDAALGLGLGPAGRFSLRGTADLAGLLDDASAKLVPTSVRVDTAIAWEPGRRLAIDSLSLRASEGEVKVQGAGDLALNRIQGTVAVHLTDLDRWAGLMAPAALAGLRLDARIDGPLSHPDFELAAAADRLAVAPAAARSVQAQLKGRVDLDDQWRPATVAVVGESRVEGLTTPGDPSLEKVLGSTLAAAFEGAFDLVSGNATVRRLEAEAKAGRFLAEGTVGGFGKSARLTAKLTLPELAAAAALAGVPAQGRGEVLATIAGDLTAPEAEIGLYVRFAELSSGEPLIATLLGPNPTLTATLSVAKGVLSFRPLKLDSAGLTLSVTGSADLADQAVDAKAEGRIADLAPLASGLGMGLRGNLVFAVTAAGDAGAQGIRTNAELTIDDFAIEQDVAKALIGPQVKAKLAAALVGDRVEVERAEVAGNGISLTATGRVMPTLDLGLTASLPELARLSGPLGAGLEGPAKLEARLSGKPDHPALTAELKAGPLVVEGTAVRRLVVTANAVDLAAAPQGNLKLETEAAGAHATLAGNYRLAEDGSLALDQLRLTLPQTDLAGQLVVLPAGLARGRLTGSVESLEPVGKLIGRPLVGAARIEVTLAAAGGAQGVEARIDARDLGLDPGGPSALSIGKLAATARLGDVLRAPRGAVELQAERVATGALSLATAKLSASGTPAALKIAADLDGSLQRPVALALAGELGLDGPATKLRLDRLTGKYGAIAARLAAPATLTYGASEVGVSGLDLRVGDGRSTGGKLTGNGRLGAKAVDLKLAVRDLPLALFRELAPTADLEGVAAADLSLEGTPARPTAQAEVRLRGVRDKGSAAKTVPPLDATATLSLRDGRGTVAARLGGPRELALEAQAAAPVSFSVAPVGLALPPDGGLSGTIKGRLDLGLVPRLVDLRGDRLAGGLDVDMTLAGTVGAPRIAGGTRIVNGSYRNAEAGTIIRDIAASITGDTERIVLQSLTANDGDGGTLSASAAVGLGEGLALGAVKGQIKLARFAIVRRDDATARMSGDLDLDRGAKGTAVHGALTVDAAEIQIPERLPPQIVKLKVKEIHQSAARKAPPAAPSPPPEPAIDLPVRLDVTVVIPGRAFVRGRGVDSEWRGRVAVGGTVAAPDVVGDLQVVRGTVDLAGTTFEVSSGTITFVGGGDIDPELDLTAIAETKDVVAQVHVTGRASEPKIALGSPTGLPQEEVMSRLLFGKSAGGLSPAQGLQLAQALASLTGGGGGSILDDLRRGVGLDVLRVQSGESATDTSVQAGKYIADDVFLKVEQGLTPESRRVGVEVKVLPRITVEGDVGAEGGSRVGVKWRYDY